MYSLIFYSPPVALILIIGEQKMTTQYLSPKYLARRWDISYRTLQRWRDNSKGLPYIKIGRQVVRYSIEDIKAYEADKNFNLKINNKWGLEWQERY